MLVHRAHIEKTIALRGIRAKNEGPKSVAHFAVNYYVCATRTHTHTYTYIHPMHKVLVLTSLRFMGYGAVDKQRERGEKEESKESKEERLLPKGVALFIS